MSGRLVMTGAVSKRGDAVVGKIVFGVGKRDELVPKDKMTDEEAARLVGVHGTRGSLPKTLRRDDRIRAYEARYVHAGGRKGERWNRKAKAASAVTTGALVGAGAGAGVELAGRVMANRTPPHPKARVLRNKGAYVGLGSTALGTASELYRRRAQRKSRTYSSASSGIAAGALRRMRDYTPED